MLARKITQTAPSAAMIKPARTPGLVCWPSSRKAKPALNSGISVKTAPVDTGSVNSSALNIVSM
ncbi:hypothetical protein D3C87_1968040 [compost metagenome]